MPSMPQVVPDDQDDNRAAEEIVLGVDTHNDPRQRERPGRDAPAGQKPTLKAAVGYSWAFSALSASPGARAHYDRRRTAGDRHIAAQRNLFNRLLGCLYHCLDTRQTYDEQAALPNTPAATEQAA